MIGAGFTHTAGSASVVVHVTQVFILASTVSVSETASLTQADTKVSPPVNMETACVYRYLLQCILFTDC